MPYSFILRVVIKPQGIYSLLFKIYYLYNIFFYIFVIGHIVIAEVVSVYFYDSIGDGVHKFCVVGCKQDVSFKGNQPVVYADNRL